MPEGSIRTTRLPKSLAIDLAALGFVITLGLALRVWGLAQESAWCDEVLTLACFPAEDAAAFFRCAFQKDPRLVVSPLYYLLEYGWSTLFGGGLLSLRLLSVSLDLLTLSVVFGVAKRLGGRWSAMLAGLLYALSLVNIHYAQEVRFYALMTLLVSLSIWGFSRLLNEKGTRLGWFAHFAAEALLLWTHAFTALFFVAPGLVALGLLPKRPKFFLVWISGHLVILGLYFFWIFGILHYDLATHSQAYNDVLPGAKELLNALLIFMGGRFSNLNPSAYYTQLASLEYLLVLLKGLLLLLALCGLLREQGGHKVLISFLALSIIVPPLLLFLASYGWRPCFMYRYVYYVTVPLCILAGLGIREVKKPLSQLCLLTLVLSAAAYQVAGLERPMRADYGAAVAAMQTDPPPSKVYALKYFNALAVDYALENVGVESLSDYDALCTTVAQALERGESSVVFFYRWQGYADFERSCKEAGGVYDQRVWGGHPPLISYAVRPARH